MTQKKEKSTADNKTVTYKYSTKAKAISELQRLDQREMTIMTDIDGKQEGKITIEGITFTLGSFNTAKYDANTRTLLEYLLTRFSEIAPFGTGATPETVFKVSSISVTLKEFMAIRGLKHKQNARAQFREAAHTLLNSSMKFDYSIKRREGKKVIEEIAHVDGYIFICNVGFRTNDEEPLRNSRIVFDMNYKLMYYLCNRSIMPVDVKMFTINPRLNPHSFNIMRKLTEHYDHNAKKKNEPVRLSVRALLEYCPELPTVDAVKGLHYSQLIRNPFERDLEALEDTYGLIKWQYCKRGGIQFTDEEKQPAEYSFNEWLDLIIEYYQPDYPVETAKRVRKRKTKQIQQEDNTIKTE